LPLYKVDIIRSPSFALLTVSTHLLADECSCVSV